MDIVIEYDFDPAGKDSLEADDALEAIESACAFFQNDMVRVDGHFGEELYAPAGNLELRKAILARIAKSMPPEHLPCVEQAKVVGLTQDDILSARHVLVFSLFPCPDESCLELGRGMRYSNVYKDSPCCGRAYLEPDTLEHLSGQAFGKRDLPLQFPNGSIYCLKHFRESFTGTSLTGLGFSQWASGLHRRTVFEVTVQQHALGCARHVCNTCGAFLQHGSQLFNLRDDLHADFQAVSSEGGFTYILSQEGFRFTDMDWKYAIPLMPGFDWNPMTT